MTTRAVFRTLMAERRQFPLGSADREYRTAAARKLAWILRGIPVNQW